MTRQEVGYRYQPRWSQLISVDLHCHHVTKGRSTGIPMTRTQHKEHPTGAFPVYALGWASDDSLIMAGGGGATKSGIENKLVRCVAASCEWVWVLSHACMLMVENMQGRTRRTQGQAGDRDQAQQR